MKLTDKQKKDLETILYFNLVKGKYSDNDLEAFFNYSEKGIKPKIETPGYKLLIEGKRWRGITIHELYEQGVLDGSMPYFTILGGDNWLNKKKWWQFWKKKYIPISRTVVDFLKKEMFKGADSEIIESCYESLVD